MEKFSLYINWKASFTCPIWSISVIYVCPGKKKRPENTFSLCFFIFFKILKWARSFSRRETIEWELSKHYSVLNSLFIFVYSYNIFPCGIILLLTKIKHSNHTLHSWKFRDQGWTNRDSAPTLALSPSLPVIGHLLPEASLSKFITFATKDLHPPLQATEGAGGMCGSLVERRLVLFLLLETIKTLIFNVEQNGLMEWDILR